MIKLEGVRLPPGGGQAELRAQAARLLRVPPEAIRDLRILRRSVDAREDVVLTYTLAAAVENEAAVLRRCRNKKAAPLRPEPAYRPPAARPPAEVPPVVVGAGPAGLFAALALALASGPSSWSGAGPWRPARRTWSASGPPGLWTWSPTSSLAKAGPGPSPTGS